MTDDRELSFILDHWLDDGPTEMPDRVIDVVAIGISRQRQRPAWRLDWRPTFMNSFAKAGAAIAAVVLVALVGFTLLPGSAGIGGAVATPTPLVTAGPSPSPTPTPTSTPTLTLGPTPFPCNDGGTGCVGELTAGSHGSTSFGPAVSFVVPDGWQNTIDNAFFYSLAGTGSTAPTIDVWSKMAPVSPGCGVTVQPGVADTVDGWIDWVTTQPGIVASQPRDVEVGGYAGKTLELQVSQDWTQMCQYMKTPGVWIVSNESGFVRDVEIGATLTWTILDVAGETVMISVASPGTPAEAVAQVAAAKPIINSFTFTP